MKLLVSEDPQKLFDHVVTSLAAQGAPCTDEMGQVAIYFEGRCCAFGWCLSKRAAKVYRTNPSFITPSSVLRELEKLNFTIKDNPFDFDTLADCHDLAGSRKDLAVRFFAFAEKRKLSTAKITECMDEEWQQGAW